MVTLVVISNSMLCMRAGQMRGKGQGMRQGEYVVGREEGEGVELQVCGCAHFDKFIH